MTQVKADNTNFHKVTRIAGHLAVRRHADRQQEQSAMMGWSVSLGRIAGTEVRIHFTFVLFIVWFGFAAALEGGRAAALDAVAFVLAVFACVLLHEYGHVLVARHFGVATRDITLLPIGGVASTERIPDKPAQELLMALAGPAVNAVIALTLVTVFGATVEPELLSTVNDQKLDFTARLAVANVMLALFNLIPAFPMDGGRVLRALLCFVVDRARATRISARIGHTIAFGLGLLGLFGNPVLLFIALFIFLAASHEAYAAELGEAAKGAIALEAAVTAIATLDTQSTVSRAVEMLLSTAQREFPIVDGMGRLRGILTRDGIIKALTETGPETPVVDVMERDVPTVNRRAPLADAVTKLQSSGRPYIGVVDDDDRVAGIISLENLAEYLMVTQASREWRRTEGRPIW